MYSNQHLYKLAQIRHQDLLREAEAERLIRSVRKNPSQKVNPRVAWALVGPAFVVVLLSLFI